MVVDLFYGTKLENINQIKKINKEKITNTSLFNMK